MQLLTLIQETTMRKTELLKEISNDTGLSLDIVKKVINSMITIVKQKLLFGINVHIRDFVSFERVVTPPTRRKDFKTGKLVDVPKRWRLKTSSPDTLKKEISKKPIYDGQG